MRNKLLLDLKTTAGKLAKAAISKDVEARQMQCEVKCVLDELEESRQAFQSILAAQDKTIRQLQAQLAKLEEAKWVCDAACQADLQGIPNLAFKLPQPLPKPTRSLDHTDSSMSTSSTDSSASSTCSVSSSPVSTPKPQLVSQSIQTNSSADLGSQPVQTAVTVSYNSSSTQTSDTTNAQGQLKDDIKGLEYELALLQRKYNKLMEDKVAGDERICQLEKENEQLVAVGQSMEDEVSVVQRQLRTTRVRAQLAEAECERLRQQVGQGVNSKGPNSPKHLAVLKVTASAPLGRSSVPLIPSTVSQPGSPAPVYEDNVPA